MDIGTVNSIDINKEMRTSYLDYAMSVIVSRALPDARDGLKPVHRRILYAMHDMGIRATGPHRKSARIVGEVLGKYHPHGDSSVYDAMVRMAQPFSLRYMLVDGQGNFGSVDGDSPAAMRYTEARLDRIANELLEDIDKNTVDFTSNFDDTLEEPELLPARLPNLLLNGSSGIAVGMSTNIPPHNLTELCDAIDYLVDHQETADDVTLDDLMQFVKAPDFPTGGLIVGTEGVKNAYATGRGRVVIRAVATVEEMPRNPNRQRIVITEIPFQVNKASIIERIAELVNKGVITEISDLRDESDRNGLSIVVELKRNTQPLKVLNQLYKHTSLQTTFSVQLLALVDKQPRLLSLKRALQIYIDHRVDVIRRRTQFELDKLIKRQHILEGLLIAQDNLDKVIALIRQAPDADTARSGLMSQFDLTEAQATAILDMQLRRLAALERQKLVDEHKEVTIQIGELRAILADKSKVFALIKEDIAHLKDKYGDERRSTILYGVDADLNIEDMIQDEEVLISITGRGYIKRTPISAYRLQGRGGKGLIGAGRREEDEIEHLFAAGTLDNILFFTDAGKVYSEKAYNIPERDRTARGTPLLNIIQMMPDEKVTVALPVPDFDEAEYLTMVTRKGKIKRVELNAFKNVRANGLIALSLEDGDNLRWVKLTKGEQQLILVSQQGKGIRFDEEDVRPMGRTAAGVNAIRLNDDDFLAGMDIASPEDDILVVTEYGYGKRTPISDYRLQNRYGQGVRAMNLDPKRTGNIVEARVVTDEDQVTCISATGIILRIMASEISRQGRITQGVRVMDLRDGDTIASVAVIREERLARFDDTSEEEAEMLAVGVNVETTETEPADVEAVETE
ncbi:MAG TPA: DNA gyrase subunit A [Anaerolineae bacterium]|nr:DNA gyrase subunit A [Anaerolineae bacterium]